MKVLKLSVHGYGCFIQREIGLEPGLQIIAGPNEQGKSTLRSFIGDMLYGQKRSIHQRLYDPSYQIRRPWRDARLYGGSLIYELDNGRVFEVHRNFDRDKEVLQVFDYRKSREITNHFTRLRNREVTFAEVHLGLTKDVFLNMATISYASLESLGDSDSLAQIREKLRSLADTGNEKDSSEGATSILADRIKAIGSSQARARPLPTLRAKLTDLQKEYEVALALREELTGAELQRQAALNNEKKLRARREALERDLEELDKSKRHALLRDATKLEARIVQATQKCFALSAARDFPTDRLPDIQRAENLVATADAQLQRLRAEREEHDQQLATEIESLGEDGNLPFSDVDEKLDLRLTEIDDSIRRLQERLKDVETALQTAVSHVEAARGELEQLPDFSRVSADPVEWLNQLTTSFELACHVRDDERNKLNEFETRINKLKTSFEGPERLFAECDDFLAQTRAYEIALSTKEDRSSELSSRVNMLQNRVDEYQGKVRVYGLMAGIFFVAMAGFAGAAYYVDNSGVYLPATLAGIGFVFFLANSFISTAARKSASALIGVSGDEMNALMNEKGLDRSTIERLMKETQSSSVRELEALYDRFHEDRAEYAVLRDGVERQRAALREGKERVEQLFDRVKKTFGSLGEPLERHSDCQEVANRCITRYQEYRDAKRRVKENRTLSDDREKERESLIEEMEKLRQDDVELSLEVRDFMRANGYADEQKHDSALSALRSYRIRSGQVRQKKGRLELLQEKTATFEENLSETETELARHKESFQKLLESTGVKTAEELRTRAKQAQEYTTCWNERTSLEEQLEAMLRGQNLDELKKAVDAAGPASHTTRDNADAVKTEIEKISIEIDAGLKEAHALHIKLTERSAGARPINEVEEERAETEHRVKELELELQAASYAMSVIEEAARDKHSRIAPQLAKVAGQYLSEITSNTYNELHIGPNLDITIRNPETKALAQGPEQFLSKGTVDQVYLALRLAMIQAMSSTGESIPMLLDDPFANYDTRRLKKALALLTRMGERHQILLFTCRDDVVDSAREAQAPILML